MPFTSTTVSNIAVTIACLVLATLGGLRIRSELTQSSAPQSRSEPTIADDSTLSIAGAEAQGEQNANTVLIEFSDFECPFCARHATDTFDVIKAEFIDTGKVRYVAMHLPLESHRYAQKAAEASQCAALQGGFWSMRQRLFANQAALEGPSLIEHAKEIGLDTGRLSLCLSGGAMTEKIKAQSEIAKTLGIRNTPVFVFGTPLGEDRVKAIKRVVGAHSIEVFRTVLGELTASKTTIASRSQSAP